MKSTHQEAGLSPGAGGFAGQAVVATLGLALLKRVQVEERLRISRAALYAKLNPDDPAHDPAFPIPIRIGARAVRWVESEIEAYILSLPRTRCASGGER